VKGTNVSGIQRFQKWAEGENISSPLIMGILNATPDSFSDGGQFCQTDAAVRRASQMIAEGADIIDVGGESTRPGASPVSLQEELDRVLPVIESIKVEFDVPVSVDTYKPQVMAESLKLGVEMVNDVNALQEAGAIEAVAQSDAMVCLMHKLGNAATMQENPQYEDVVEEVMQFLQVRAQACVEGGISADRIILDPGFGFGKTFEHNVRLFEELDRLIMLEFPVLVGVSRKRMIGKLMGDVPVEERMIGSVAAAVVAAMKGASILRVHDVKETKQAIDTALALV
jgi:dihydropteroate synthase